MDVITATVAEARAAGLDLRVDGDRLVVRGPRQHEALAQCLLDRKVEVLALLTAERAEIAWRTEAMRPQIPPDGPIPFLIARDAPVQSGRCLSCGDPLAAGQGSRCRLCIEAARQALRGPSR